jgi:hypothetical protein
MEKRVGRAVRPRRRGRKADGPNPIDVLVGARVRMRRTMLGLSQASLGEAIGLTSNKCRNTSAGPTGSVPAGCTN